MELANHLTTAQALAWSSYMLLSLISIAWMFRFKRFALYAVPPLMVSLHGAIFYGFLWYTGNMDVSQIWSPYLRMQSALTFALMMMLMWEKIARREVAVGKAEELIQRRLADTSTAIRASDELYELRMNGAKHE